MKNNLKATLFILLFFLVVPTTHAQIWKKVKKSVERTVENRAEREAEKAANDAIDEALKDLEGNEEEDDAEGSQSDFMKLTLGSSTDLPAQYQFDYKIAYKITSNKDETDITYLLDNEASNIGFVIEGQKENNIMVMDMDRKLVAMFMQNKKGEKSGQVLPNMVSKKFFGEKIAESHEKTKVVKTGRTKIILGYTCDEYQATSEEGEANIWIAPKIKTSLSKIFGASMTKNKKAKNMSALMQSMDGFVMESDYTDHKNEKNNTYMIATKIDLNPEPLKKGDYQWIN